ncbi:MAG: hypothetical protein K8S14_09210 [Actinomycetia bacterium]|nr:hypothetical protein [Actinomycetes bacterium]
MKIFDDFLEFNIPLPAAGLIECIPANSYKVQPAGKKEGSLGEGILPAGWLSLTEVRWDL